MPNLCAKRDKISLPHIWRIRGSMAKLYTDVKIPKELSDEIDDLIKSGYRGYRSRGEFVCDSARHRLEEIEKLRKQPSP